MTLLDPERPTIRLCVAGVEAEAAGDGEAAAALYTEAWDAALSDVDRAVAAHYLARVQPTEEGRRQLNRAALGHALAAGSAARDLLPSLYLNLGWSQELAGDVGEARRAYGAGEDALAVLTDRRMADSLRPALVRARERMAVMEAAWTDWGTCHWDRYYG